MKILTASGIIRKVKVEEEERRALTISGVLKGEDGGRHWNTF